MSNGMTPPDIAACYKPGETITLFSDKRPDVEIKAIEGLHRQVSKAFSEFNDGVTYTLYLSNKVLSKEERRTIMKICDDLRDLRLDLKKKVEDQSNP